MTPEQMVMLEQAAASLESVINPFADQSTRVKQRLLEAGWSQEGAEAFVLGVTGPLIAEILAGTEQPGQIVTVPAPPGPSFRASVVAALIVVLPIIALLEVLR